ncbi:hypothetical protein BS78_01G348000 [Paspalum vaginatum]|nr:hypothetical protein BS78_01G348000 [Paspalum vaginatum]
MGLLLRRRVARHRAPPRRHPPLPLAQHHAQVQAPTRPSAVAGDRQPQPDRLAPAPLHPRALGAVRPAHVPPLRLRPRRRGLVRGRGQVLPPHQRRRVHRPPKDGLREVHRLQLLRHRLGALRRVLAPGAQAVADAPLQRAAAQVAGARPRRGGARPAAGPARPVVIVAVGRGRAQGAPAHAQPQRDLAHGAGQEVRRRGHRWLAGLAGRVQVDGGRAVRAQRRAQRRGLHPVAQLDGPSRVRREDEEAGQDVRWVLGARGRRAQGAAAAGGPQVRCHRYGGPAAGARRRSQPRGPHRTRRRQGIHSGPHRWRHGHLGGDHRVGHVGATEEAGGARQGHRGAGQSHRPRPPRHGAGRSQPPVPGRRREGDLPAAPGDAAAGAAAVPRGRVHGQLRHPGGHAGVRQRLGHWPRPCRVGAHGGGVLAGAVRRQRRGRQGPGPGAAAVRVRPPDVPRLRARAEDGAGDPGEPAARLRVEAPRWRGGGGAEHAGKIRTGCPAYGASRGRRRAQAAGSPLRRALMHMHACISGFGCLVMPPSKYTTKLV